MGRGKCVCGGGGGVELKAVTLASHSLIKAPSVKCCLLICSVLCAIAQADQGHCFPHRR